LTIEGCLIDETSYITECVPATTHYSLRRRITIRRFAQSDYVYAYGQTNRTREFRIICNDRWSIKSTSERILVQCNTFTSLKNTWKFSCV